MQKQYLTNEINFRNLIKDKKDDEENFERIFSLVFKPSDLFDEGNQNKLYFQESFTFNPLINLEDIKDNNLKMNVKNENKNKFVIKEEIEIINKDKKISINNITEINQTLLQNKQKIKNNFKIEERADANDTNDNGNKSNERKINIKSTFSTIKRKVWKRGPYKTKNRVIVKEKFEDKCFPFTKGKGLINFIDNTGNVVDKSSEIKLNEEQNLSNTTFKINRYFKDSKGKIKKIKKRRKYKPDDIRKKIKLSFHKALKNIINENLKKTGSEGLFSFLPQTFLANISKMFNKKYMNSTYEDLLAMDFTQNKTKGINLEIEQRHYDKNIDVLNYLENNPEISKKSGFDRIKKMKYKDLLEAYFLSKEFENAVVKLKNKHESDEYIETYIFLSKNYISYYSN
jgi:hypothetical protein